MAAQTDSLVQEEVGTASPTNRAVDDSDSGKAQTGVVESAETPDVVNQSPVSGNQQEQQPPGDKEGSLTVDIKYGNV